MKEHKERNFNIDLVKTIAVFFVISVHFFLNTNFYEETLIGKNMFLNLFLRQLFITCVPLFMITTGYLMCKKELNKKYVFGILKILLIYILFLIFYVLFRIYYLHDLNGVLNIIKTLFSFPAYSWYVEMYIGMYFLIPFINLIYNNLNSKHKKEILIFILILLTAIPNVFNIRFHLFPNWWGRIYPITYYFIGAYLREYKINISKTKNIFLIIFSLILFTLLDFYLFKGDVINWGIQDDYGSLTILLISVLIFEFIMNIRFDKINIYFKKVIGYISNITLPIYLMSIISDTIIYKIIFKSNISVSIRNYIFIVPIVFVISILLASGINIIYSFINKKIIKKIERKFNV